MLKPPTYPGIYIEELPGGVRTITGVATSITAFIGRSLQGPLNEPTIIGSFGDFERCFGGLSIDSTMSYGVRDFYNNGGTTALIVRIAADGAKKSKVELSKVETTQNVLNLFAKNEGKWGDMISVEITHDGADPTPGVTAPPEAGDPDKFNLIIYYNKLKREEHLNVTLKKSEGRFLPLVLEQSSALLEVETNSSGDWSVSEFRPERTVEPVFAIGGEDGNELTKEEYLGNETNKTGIYALRKADLFNLLCIPPSYRHGDTDPEVYQKAMKLCVERKAMLIVDSPYAWGKSPAKAASESMAGLSTLGLSGTDARNAALYFPRVMQTDPNLDNLIDSFVPCGIIAGIIAKTDRQHGVWKSPAGIDASITGIHSLQVKLTDQENGQLNPLGINCLRSFQNKNGVIWGARTLRGANLYADEFKYIAVRRTALFVEESLYRGTKWVIYEPNDESLWAKIRLNVSEFMHNLFLKGAFRGSTPKEAYFVKCDNETSTQIDIHHGIINILVGFAPLKPAEFIILNIEQSAG